MLRNFGVLLLVSMAISLPMTGQENQPPSTSLLGRLQKLEEENLELRKQILEMQKQILVLLQQNQTLYQQNLLFFQNLNKKSEEQVLTPIGAIVAWHKSLTHTPPLPQGWVECNGQTLNDPESVYHGVAIPNLNGQERFLRGSGTSGIMQAQDWKSFTVAGFTNGGYTHGDVLIPKTGYNTSPNKDRTKGIVSRAKMGSSLISTTFSLPWNFGKTRWKLFSPDRSSPR